MAKKTEKQPAPICVLMDSSSLILARGACESPPDAPSIQIRITDGKIEDVVAAETVQVLSPQDAQPARLGRVIRHRGDVVVLELLQLLGKEIRQNFRIPVDFESFIYPPGGGRVAFSARDLSCGGILFYADADFAPGDRMEIVIPITRDNPLLLNCEILRQHPAGGPLRLYAAKFVDLIHDEEARVREAVFSAELKQRPEPTTAKGREE